MKKLFLVMLILSMVLPISWFLYHEFEGKVPIVDLQLPSFYLNRSYEMNLSVEDKGTGLRSVNVVIVQADREKVLLKKQYNCLDYKGFFMGSGVFQDTFTIPVEARKYGITDGEAVFRIDVTDFSWKGWNRGNNVHLEKKVIIDSKAPKIEVLTTRHNVARGGAGLVVYRLFEDDLKSGVRVGDNFYPGHPNMFPDKNLYSAFFALNYTQGPGTEIFIEAEDPAGNTASRGFYHYIKDKKFRYDTLNIPDSFLARKMPEFDLGAKEESLSRSVNPFLEKFLEINRKLRKKNIHELLSVMDQSETELMWSGVFLRLPRSATRAKFADHRIYKYKGKEIDRQVHMGIDLASVSRADIPAANRGRVLLSKNVGIFGNTVVLDHGFGLATFYSHLSSIDVFKGDVVEKGQIIGKTGATGMAGGDHLHYGVAVHKTFVNPLEWWDMTWITNNILSKFKEIDKEVNQKG